MPTLLVAASSAEVWNNTAIKMSHDFECVSCKIPTIKAIARIKHPSTKPGQVFLMDILLSASDKRLIPKSNFFAIWTLADAFSRFSMIIGISDKSTGPRI